MTFVQMRYFLTLAQTLSFTETAKQTFTTQPTISRQIHALEEELGQPLFLRRGSSIQLTPTGQMFYKNLADASRLIDESLYLAKNNIVAYEGSLRVACAISLDLEPFLVACYKQFSALYPKVKFHFVKAPVPEMHAKVRTHDYDVIICHELSTGVMNGMEKQRLFEYGGCLVYSKSLSVARKEGLTPKDFSGVSIICLDNESSARGIAGIEKIASQIQLKFKSIITVPNLETVFFYVHAGFGVAILDMSLKEIRNKAVDSIPLHLKSARVAACAAWDGRNQNPAIMPFVNILKLRAPMVSAAEDLYY